MKRVEVKSQAASCLCQRFCSQELLFLLVIGLMPDSRVGIGTRRTKTQFQIEYHGWHFRRINVAAVFFGHLLLFFDFSRYQRNYKQRRKLEKELSSLLFCLFSN